MCAKCKYALHKPRLPAVTIQIITQKEQKPDTIKILFYIDQNVTSYFNLFIRSHDHKPETH